MLRIAICEDNCEDGEMIESAFDKLPQGMADYDIYFRPEELLTHSRKNDKPYQMYILDIKMPGMNGLDLARQIRKSDTRALIVFLTGYTEYAMKAFDVITFDYLQKPITAERLEMVIGKAHDYLNIVNNDFVFCFRKNQFRVSCDDILYIQKRGRQAMIHTSSDTYKTNMTNMELWEQLDERAFSHIHVSYIINLEHIKAIEGNEVILDNREHFMIARSHKQKLKEKHLEFVKRMV